MRYTKKKRQVFFNHLIEFFCLECKISIHRIDLIVDGELQSSDIIKGCSHFPVIVPQGKALVQRKDKKPESLGGVRF